MSSPPVCSKCKNVSLRFNDDGTGFCNVCSRTFVWNRPGVPEPPICRRCKVHSLSFMPEGYGWCHVCFNKFIWRPGANIDLTEVAIPQSPRVGGQPTFDTGGHEIQSAIFSKKGKRSSDDFIGDSKIEFDSEGMKFSVLFSNLMDHSVNEVVVRPVHDQKIVVLDKKEIMVPVLRKGEKRIIGFKVSPKREARRIELYAEVKYYNPEMDEYMIKNTEKLFVELRIPGIHRVQIPENIFQRIKSELVSTEEEYNDINIGGEALFEIMRDMLQSQNLFLLPAKVRTNDNLFIGRQGAYGEDDDDGDYRCVLEVIGGRSRSKVLVTFSASTPEDLMGFSLLMKGGIEKRIDTAHLETTTIVQQHFHGDFVSEGASKVAIHDSVVQRSNIGADIKVNDGLDEKIQWLDDRNKDRNSELRRGQRSIKKKLFDIEGMTEEIAKNMEHHFGQLMKDLPYPSKITRKRSVVIMEYTCSLNGEYIGRIKDRRWMRWVHFTIGAAMVGVGAATFSAELGGKGIKKLYNDLTGKPLDDLPKESFFLTTEEKDEMLVRLREEGILEEMNYCPACHNWVCEDCFDPRSMLCIDHAN